MGEKEEYRMVSTNEGDGPSGPKFTSSSRRRIYIIVGVVCLVVIIAVAVALGIYFGARSDGDKDKTFPSESPPTPAPIKVDSSFEIHLVLNTEYLDDFDDPATAEYQTLKDEIERLIDTIMTASNLKEYIRNTITGFKYTGVSNGPVKAVDKIDFKERLGLPVVKEEVLMKLKQGLTTRTTEVDALHIRLEDTTVTETTRTGIVRLGETCTIDSDCSDRNSQCVSSSSSSSSSSSLICRCLDGYHDSNFVNSTGGTCVKLLRFGEYPCRLDRECQTPESVCLYRQCTCDPKTRFFNNDQCELLSEQPTFCPRSIPNEYAILEPECIDDHSAMHCKVTCKTGYQLNSPQADLYDVYIYCSNGTWTTYKSEYGYGVSSICLPEADFRLCPLILSEPLKLEKRCGPETDWLCDFTCYDGYRKHPFMSGRLRSIEDQSEWYRLYCDQGVWKTGYEDVGLNVTGVCFSREQNCTKEIPNGDVYLPCTGGYSCSFKCNPGYHIHALASAKWPICVEGEWLFRESKYDQTITPENVCIADDTNNECQREIKNGRISNSTCRTKCRVDCNDGYYFPEGIRYPTCNKGSWLTEYYHYTGDNICFPSGGYACPYEIPNGTVGYSPDAYLKDNGETGRIYDPYLCNKGYRKHRAINHVECLTGYWITGLERFGIGAGNVCIPFDDS